MFKITLTIAAMLLATAASFGTCVDKRPGLSPDCKDVIHRTGDRTTITGQHMAGPDQATLRALQTVPPDDSGKFNCSILISDHPQFKPACDKLLHDLDVAEQMLAFVKVKDPAKSWMIPQVRKFEDPSQKHWIDGIRPLLFPVDKQTGKAIPLTDADGKAVAPIPAIIIKPPLDGRYGNNEEVVTFLCGYHGNVQQTCDKLQVAVEEWIHRYESDGQIKSVADDVPQAGRPAADLRDPFSKPLPVNPGPFDPNAQAQWPGRFNKSEPKPLTAKQIRELIPDAPKDFRAELAEEEFTDPAKVREAWLTRREADLKAAEKAHADRVQKLNDDESKAYTVPQPAPVIVQQAPFVSTDDRQEQTESEVDSTPANPPQAQANHDWLEPVSIGIIAMTILGWRYRDVVTRKALNSSNTSSMSSTEKSKSESNTTANTPGTNAGDSAG